MNLGKKISGGGNIRHRKRKAFEIAGQRKIVKLGNEKRRAKRIRGGSKKIFLLGAKFINIQDKGKSKKMEIKNVVETPSNRFLARQNIITKGTIVLTEAGKVKVTNRPTENGVLNGIVIE
ncbi:30S ribosomal protein S8e [Candidatus Pacearchaeota archaeon]|nr:30S ribosomal protein S8e [Candidatus Pacearchaeota archaeon]